MVDNIKMEGNSVTTKSVVQGKRCSAEGPALGAEWPLMIKTNSSTQGKAFVSCNE